MRITVLYCGLSALLCALASCKQADSERNPAEAVQLQGELASDTTTFGLPQALLEYAGHRIVIEGRLGSTGKAFAVFDSAGVLIGQFGRAGSGPGEFAAPLSLMRDPRNDSVAWVFDGGLARLTAIELGPLIRGTLVVDTMVAVKPMVAVDAPVWIGDTVLVALGAPFSPTDGRFVRIGASGELLETFGPPPPGSDELPAFVRQQVYGGRIVGDPARGRFIVASRYAPFIDVFDNDGQQVGRLLAPEPFEPDYTVAPDGINMIRGEEFRFGYVDVAATRDRIYGLYSGRLRRDYPDTQNLASEIHVFAWDGRLIARYSLDGSGMGMALGEAPDELLIAIIDPVPQIKRYFLR